MLALMSTSSTIRLTPEADGSLLTAFLMNGRANPNASRHNTAQRSASSRTCSRRLRRVRRGDVGSRNMSELNTARSRVVRRIR